MSEHDDVLGRHEADHRAYLLDDLAYDITLDLGDSRAATFEATSRVTFGCRQPGASTFIDLTAPAVVSATLNGRALPGDAFDGHRVQLDALEASNELVIVARSAFQRTGTGLHRFVDPADGAVYLHTQFEPFDAHTAYACFDQPDLKARFRLTVRAPAEWTVVSNEPVESRTPDVAGLQLWRFQPTPPISTYITALVAGPLHAVVDQSGPVPLGLYSRESLARYLEPDEMFEITRAGMDFFAEMFGRPYPFAKYDQVFVPEFNWGAMENAGCVTFSERFLFRSRVTDAARTARGATILHELGHMWFGNLVTMRWWGDLWLNESFATYVAYWALTERTRFTAAWVQFANREVPWAIDQDQLPTTHPIVADAPDTDTALNNFDGITYAKGALVLTQLVAWVGVDAFARGLQDYFARHAWGNAELTDFLNALEKSSGRPLALWAQQWLETTGVNTLQLDLQVDAEGRYAAVDVMQQQAAAQRPQPRDQRIAIGLYDIQDDDVIRRARVELDITGVRTPVPALTGQPAADMILPNDGLLSYAKVRLDDASLATMRRHLGQVREPLSRAHCWLIAWDLLRDAQLPAHQYVELVADHAPGESDPDTLRKLLAQALLAADRYGAPERRGVAYHQLADSARETFAASAPDSDAQLVWARCRIAVDGPAWAQDLLDGNTAPEGLTVDYDLRWYAITQLARRGAIDSARIAAEHERDQTDEGLRRASAARAALPDAHAKADAWAIALDPSHPLALRRAVCEGFHQHQQTDQLRSYVERYEAVLPELWSGQVRQESLDMTEGLFPRTVVEVATVAMAQRALRLPTVPDAGKRVLVEQIDELQRALGTRTADTPN